MLLLGCASRGALALRLPQVPTRRPSRGCDLSDDQVNAPIEMVSSVQYVERVPEREPPELLSRVAFIPTDLGTIIPGSLMLAVSSTDSTL
ncbi:hypothetical protein B296_00041579 [Ensete ventricosum]|uniref:Uncharacterized protein n=1 Tax=Ensete ventricosum TaxID=4639 RepID=A0A426ZFW8_ENSVE|nr:hypothetical protein B296_00041579 [Ensete ventricosum]